MGDVPIDIERIKRSDNGEPYIIDVVSEESDGYEINLKWDGCIDIRRRNGGHEYLHICDVGQFIHILEEVISIAKNNFGDNFDEYWSDSEINE